MSRDLGERAAHYRAAVAAEINRREYLLIGNPKLLEILPTLSNGELVWASAMNDEALVRYIDAGPYPDDDEQQEVG